MAFTVGDFQDLVRLLDQHPEWRAELRRLVLTEELLELPAVVRRLAESVERLAESVGHLDERVGHLDERVGRLDERVGGLDERVARLETAIAALAEAQARAEQRLNRAEVHIGDLRGWQFESRYRERAAAYFRRVVRRPTPLSTQQLVDLLDSPEAVDHLSEAERDDVLFADLVIRGRGPDGEGDVYVVAGVSATIDAHDVLRAARRAALLGRLSTTLALVAGESITADAEVLAGQRGVWWLLDGRAEMPAVRAG